MWAIRILTGPQAGQIIPLKLGKNRMGRAPACEVRLASTGVSKEHAQIFMTDDKVILSDMGSRNGTFVNGVRIQNQKLQDGDKITLHEMLVDLVQVPDNAVFPSAFNNRGSGTYGQPGLPAAGGFPNAQFPQTGGSWPGDSGAPHQGGYLPGPSGLTPPSGLAPMSGDPDDALLFNRKTGLAGMYQSFVLYLENVAMPGIYDLARKMEYRWAIGLLVALYVLTMTGVTVLPTLSLIKTSVQEESQRRARTIARNLAAINSQAVVEKSEIALNTRPAELEDGVTTALIISARDGSILAPANQRGSFADKTFVARAKRSEKEFVEQIDSSTVGASTPIQGFNSDTRLNVVLAYAVVIYDMSSVVSKESRAVSLFIQILGIAGILGLLLFFFLIRVIEHPVEELNSQLNDALREGRDDLATTYQHRSLATLASNINSALSRISTPQGGDQQVFVDRESEARQILNLIDSAALVVNGIDDRIIGANSRFDRLVGGGVDLRNRPLGDIPDAALQQNLKELVPRIRANPSQIATGEIPFLGEPFEIRGYSVAGSSGDPAYYVITLQPLAQEDVG